MKKISINTNHFLTFSQLPAEKVKSIVVGLLSGDITNIQDAESRGIALIISNESLTLSAIRKKAGSTKSDCEKLSTQKNLSYPHKIGEKPEQSEQSEQSEQNEQSLPLASPSNRMTKNINIKLNQSGVRDVEKSNCFNQHLEKCERVPVRTEEEREPYVKAFNDIFAEIDKMGYEKSEDDPNFDSIKKIAKESQKQLYLNALYEIIDTFIEMLDKFKTTKYLHCGKEKLFRDDIAQMILRCDYSVLYKILYQLAIRPTTIENHPYYILRSIYKNLKEKEKMS